MKILVFATHRSRSTFLCEALSEIYKLKNMGELHQRESLKSNDTAIKKLFEQNDFVVKFLSRYFCDDESFFNGQDWNNFDKIFFCERENIADQIFSFYHMLKERKIMKMNEISSIDIENLLKIVSIHKKYLQKYYAVKKDILQKYNKSTYSFVYEHFPKTNENLNHYFSEKLGENVFLTQEKIKERKTNILYNEKYASYYNVIEKIVSKWDLA